MNFGDFFLPQKSLKMRDVLEKMRECGKLPNLRDFPHDCGMVDTYVMFCITCHNAILGSVLCTTVSNKCITMFLMLPSEIIIWLPYIPVANMIIIVV